MHVFRIGNYLTDGDRLYRVEHITADGQYVLENCQTGFKFDATKDYMKKLKLRLVVKGGENYE